MRALFVVLISASLAYCQAIPKPGYQWKFPRDHGAHREFATEWWYVTGHLTPRGRPDAAPSGFQFTVFRVSAAASPLATESGRFAVKDLYLAHFALTDESRFAHDGRVARPGPGWSSSTDLDVGCDGWTLRRDPAAGAKETWHLSAIAGIGALDLELVPTRAPTIHGEEGVHQKGPCETCASHYASVTRLAAKGTRDGEAVEGEAWFDHEFMSGGLGPGQTGWDWLGLHLSDGSDLMVARMRGSAATPDRTDGTLVDPSRAGSTRLPLGSIALTQRGRWKSPVTGGDYPVKCAIGVASEELILEVDPLRDDQELVTTGTTGVVYWEGLCRVRGTRRGKPVTGLGYLEMTGYSGVAPLTPEGPGGRR